MTHVTPQGRQPIFNLPPATRWLVIANIVVFALTALLPGGTSDAIITAFGFTPVRYDAFPHLDWQAVVDPLTYQFLHGGLAHIGINMLGLVAFGAGVERRLGAWRLIVFYLVCGVVGAFAEFVLDPTSGDVMIGASAAISGLFGGILRFAAFRRSFWVLVVLWFVTNAATGITGVGSEGEPVAWIAHIGGFVAGLALYPLVVRREFAGK